MNRLAIAAMAVLLASAVACNKSDKDKGDTADKADKPTAKDFAAYRDKAKESEARLVLNILSKDVKLAFLDNNTLPAGNATDPDKPCCTYPDHKCPAAAPPADSVLAKLSFQRDMPGYFQYHYDSDGKTATATATGDLACDGHAVTFTMHLSVENGAVVSKLDEPADK
jgi:hypothetical protein